MELDAILVSVLAFFQEQYPDDTVTADMALTDTLGTDSLIVQDIIYFLEEEFEVQLEPKDIEDFESPGRIAKIVARKLS
jgi:acyl carrier protein